MGRTFPDCLTPDDQTSLKRIWHKPDSSTVTGKDIDPARERLENLQNSLPCVKDKDAGNASGVQARIEVLRQEVTRAESMLQVAAPAAPMVRR